MLERTQPRQAAIDAALADNPVVARSTLEDLFNIARPSSAQVLRMARAVADFSGDSR